jgi:A118 family predicted phage portal protein
VGKPLWEQIKQFAKGVMIKLGLVKELKEVQDHKEVNVNEEDYQRIELNKQLYQGYVAEWHDLKYRSTTGLMIERKQNSLNMPKHLAKKMARLLLNEGTAISIAKDSAKENQWERVKDVFESSKFIRELQRYVEYMFAMGGVALEIYRDGDKPKIAYATADAFFPLSNDTEQVDEAVIANQFSKNDTYYTLLKWHEWIETEVEGAVYNYRIKNELYKSKDPNKLGKKVPLTEYFDDMAEEMLFRRETPLFIYIKPNEANNKNISSPLGISIFENAHDTIRMLDVMYDFWYNEFRLGKRRVAVPEYLVQTGHDKDGRPYVYFDDSEELFVAMNSGEMEEMQMKDLTVELRVEQVINSIQAMLDILSMQVGLSAGTFTFTEKGMKTATQVISENSETFQTRGSHLSVLEDALRDLVVSVYEVVTMDDDEGAADPLERMDISIDFNDGVFTDSQSRYNYWAQAYKDGLVPIEKALMHIHRLSEEEAKEWADELNQNTQQVVINRRRAIAQAELELER